MAVLIRTLALILLLAVSVNSTTYYVGNDGSDANNGTSTETPWEYLSKACTSAAISAGDTIYIMGGVYSEERTTHCWYENQLDPARDMWDGPLLFNSGNSGTEGNEIVYKAFPDSSRPIIDGSSDSSIACDCFGASYLVFDGLEFKDSFKGGVVFCEGGGSACHDITVKNCVSDSNCVTNGDQDQNGGGIFFMWCNSSNQQHTNIVITACTLFFNRSFENHNASGIHGYDTHNCIFEYNVIYNHPMIDSSGLYPGNGICFKEGDTLGQPTTKHDSLTIRYNTIYDCARGIRGNGYTTFIHHNIIYDCSTTAITSQCDSKEDYDMQIYNNTAYDCGAGILHRNLTGGWIYEPKIWNNIVINCNTYDYDCGSRTNYYVYNDSFTNFYSDYNCYWNDGWDSTYWRGRGADPNEYYSLTTWQALWADSTQKNGAHSIQSYPIFADTTVAGGYDLSLASDSPCRTSGRGGEYEPYMGADPPSTAKYWRLKK